MFPASLVVVGFVCGCAADRGAPPVTPAVAPPSESPVRYSDVRPQDLIPNEYRVMPGDVLEISVSDLVAPGVDTKKVVRVKESGTISLPLIGPIPVAGLTEEELNEAVREALSVLCL
jgi:protein involved in polysaccharide export with SLBB domain